MNTLSKKILEANSRDTNGYISIPIIAINRSDNCNNLGPKKNKPYFFIEKNNDATIRHCRIYKGVFLDYTIKGTKWFETITEWATHYDVTTWQVKFGFETPDPRFSSVYINLFFRNIDGVIPDPVIIPPVTQTVISEPINEFTILEQKMKKLDLGFKHLAIVNNSNVIMATTFMDIV
jgi:hypothetical protein